MRAFVAVELPEHIKARIFHEFETLMEKDVFGGKFVEKENLHLTLNFLGEISEEKAKKVIDELKGVKFDKFSCSIGKVGCFPSREHIKVIWVELISENNKLKGLYKAIKGKIGNADEREFESHITTARVKFVKNKNKLAETLGKIHFKKLDFKVDYFSLIKSELTKQGPIYRTIEKFNLS
ncbi:RNA 2',3'-cyclic phosphodiesterase [Candidatus Pacearchaeota archaeon]|nr:RNA 2',3'-cyclic phosphodiesterase [Candidatus Pacearchaeota archaeon]